jgi:hypothetical protein
LLFQFFHGWAFLEKGVKKENNVLSE